jgi:hypothetical protein
MAFYIDAERLGRVRQIGRLHRLRRLADLKLDVVVLKKIGCNRGFDGEIDVLRDRNQGFAAEAYRTTLRTLAKIARQRRTERKQ